MPQSLTAHAEAAPLRCVQTIRAPRKSIGSDSTLRLRYPTLSPAWQVAFSVDARYMAVAFGAPDNCVRIYQQYEGSWRCVDTLQGVHTRAVRSLAFAPLFTPHAHVLAAASFDGTITIWEHNNYNNGVDESAIAKKIQNTRQQRTTAEPQPGQPKEQRQGVDEEYSEEDQHQQDDPQDPPIVTDEWDCKAQLEGHDNEVKCVAWNATATMLATCGRDKTVWIWECHLPGQIGSDESDAEWECLTVLHGHEGDVKNVMFAPSHQQWGDGDEILLSCGYDGRICVWAEDDADWYLASTLHADERTTGTIWSMALAPGGVRAVASLSDGSIRIYKAYSYEEKQTLGDEAEEGSNGMWKCVGRLPDAHQGPAYSVSYAPSKAGHGRWASSGADGVLQIYREALTSTSNEPKFSLEAAATSESTSSSCEWNQVLWHPIDGSRLITVGDDGIVRVWKYGSY